MARKVMVSEIAIVTLVLVDHSPMWSFSLGIGVCEQGDESADQGCVEVSQFLFNLFRGHVFCCHWISSSSSIR